MKSVQVPASLACFSSSRCAAMMIHLYVARELLDAVFSHLDSTSLSSCTLLGSYFHDAARAQLFRSICLYHDDPWEYTLNTFHDFLDAKDASDFDERFSVRTHIRHLRVRGNGIPSYRRAIAASEIRRVLDRLPALKTLHLEEITLVEDPQVDTVSYPVPHWIHALKLTRVCYGLPFCPWSSSPPSPPNGEQQFECCFVQLLNLFTTIKILELIETYRYRLPIEGPEESAGNRSCLLMAADAIGCKVSGKVRIDRIISAPPKGPRQSNDFLLQLLRRSRALDDLSALDVTNEINLCGTPEFWTQFGHRLRYLRLAINNTAIIPANKYYDISPCTNLLSLHLVLDVRLEVWYQTTDVKLLAKTLQSTIILLPPSVQKLAVQFRNELPQRAHDIWIDSHFDWPAVDESLSRHGSLASVIFTFENARNSSRTFTAEEKTEARFLRERLPRLHGSQRLVFSCLGGSM